MKSQTEIQEVLSKKRDELQKTEEELNKVDEKLWTFPIWKGRYEGVQKIKGEIKFLEWVLD